MSKITLMRVVAIATIMMMVLWYASGRVKGQAGRINFIPLRSIKGISSEVLEAQGKVVNIADPVQFLPERKLFRFEVSARGQEYEFAGDAAKILHFVKEMKFLDSQAINWSDKAGEVVNGGAEAVATMAEGLWSMIRHPIDTVANLGSAAGGIVSYGAKYIKGEVNPSNDISYFAECYFDDKCMAVAHERGLNFHELESSQAKALFSNLAKYKVGGQVSIEVATLFLSFTKVPKVASLTKLGRFKNLFRFAAAAEIGAARMAEAEKAIQAMSNLERLAPLLNPERIKVLKAPNALNSRMSKVMYWLRQEELAGRNVSESLLRSMKMAGESKGRTGPKSFSHPAMDHKQILKNYNDLKEKGVFDLPQNMDALRRGGGVVTREGRELDANHIIPKSLAPELENTWANLEYMDFSVNRGLRNTMTKASEEKLLLFKKAGGINADRYDEILLAPSAIR